MPRWEDVVGQLEVNLDTAIDNGEMILADKDSQELGNTRSRRANCRQWYGFRPFRREPLLTFSVSRIGPPSGVSQKSFYFCNQVVTDRVTPIESSLTVDSPK